MKQLRLVNQSPLETLNHIVSMLEQEIKAHTQILASDSTTWDKTNHSRGALKAARKLYSELIQTDPQSL